ncbi:dimethylsulfonioproprionate lyase family protein [Alisedimentitalea sp. MJ-SS2]|uniref:dimethylsulfonioproprionate lyase family protein n=1 Tax=Aliisedimentitalea sp. MJ-SS2 TaxID=3049795 RepID=UPI002910E5DE|nr:dimethylsulfonioproprionate lyase family protein [Alisedimentitalea sp. MJ-SS2]MDU8928975.1 dimethylsulfonioproprionate lyase family protein [Alisedimentitalea sp. MJ-SS2]
MSHPTPHKLSSLMMFLAGLYAGEHRKGAHDASCALIKAATTPMPLPLNDMPQLALDALAIDAHPGHEVIARALPHLHWTDASGAIAGLKPDWAAGMLVNELIGPTGQFYHPTVRVGLYVQQAGFHYGLRTHPAEETYILLGGRSLWGTGDDAPVQRHTGEIIHHPSVIPHQTLTRDAPLIATWRWSGDIAYDGYAMVDSVAETATH